MKELLIPVGSMESLIVAVKSGADAVYLGGKKFGARAFATNFDNEEMIKAIKFAHLYGVKIYVTVNTLVFESELEEALEYCKFLHENGVDAVIIQDIGLISLIRRVLPNLEVHASTQVHNTNDDGLKLLSDLGVKRVVLARELSIDEINSINTDMEKEVFIHGALCICYSGECLFSSLLMNRSGNRGACAQMCRLPFKLVKNNDIVKTDGDYLLSTKELNTSTNFKNIMDSDIVSLKVEGRMKSPEYVGCVTRLYRDLIDKYNRGEELIPDSEISNDLKVIFNREYTLGFLNNVNNHELMNIKTCNHLGVYLGKVIDVSKKYIKVKLNADLRQGDGIRFNEINEGMIANFIYDKKENLISEASAGDIVLFDRKYDVNIDDTVNKTLDVLVIDKYRNVDFKNIKIDVNFKVLEDYRLSLSVTDGENNVSVIYGEAQIAKNAPISKERVIEQLSKLGNTPFIIDNIDIVMDDNLFINIKDINELRRNAINELTVLRENKKKEVIINEEESDDIVNSDIKGISVLCRNEEQVIACLELNVDRVYITDKNLYNKYKSSNNVYFRTYRVNDNTNNLDNVLSTELGALHRLGGIADYYLNIANHETINYFSRYAKLLTLSVELSFDEINNIMNYYKGSANLEVIVYSNIELMITKYCPLNMLVNDKKVCNVCVDNNKYYLLDRNDKKFRILTDPNIHLTHIMNYKPTNNLDMVPDYKRVGIKNFRIELLDEDRLEVKDLINELKEKMDE